MRQIKKIKYKEGSVSIEYLKTEKSFTKEVNFRCYDEPNQTFKTSLESLRGPLLHICELPSDYGENLTITSVSISNVGYTITGLKTLQNKAVMSINTPHIKFDDKEFCCLDLIQDLEEAAESYLDGSRATKQLKLVS